MRGCHIDSATGQNVDEDAEHIELIRKTNCEKLTKIANKNNMRKTTKTTPKMLFRILNRSSLRVHALQTENRPHRSRNNHG